MAITKRSIFERASAGRADTFSKDGIPRGELGLFNIIAYAAGQLVQAVGNYIKWAWWKCQGEARGSAGW
jgi:hypothetical protein